MPGVTKIGLITNARELMSAHLLGQQPLRRQENTNFNPNAIRHTNTSIPNPQNVITRLTSNIDIFKGLKTDLLV
ncbi:MAG: hypothetical protein AB1546_16585 [bacterium]